MIKARPDDCPDFTRCQTCQGAELFDPSIFALSMAEAAAIDPQQRLLLEAAQTAFQSAGREPEQLMESCVGVFVGQCQYDWGYKHCEPVIFHEVQSSCVGREASPSCSWRLTC